VVCPNKRDYYTFCSASGDRLSVRIDFVDALGDIDMTLYRDDGTQLGSSNSFGDFEEIVLDPVFGDVCYELEVRVLGQVANSYSLEVTAEPSALGCDIRYEPNDTFDDAIASSSELGDAATGLLGICPRNDVDVFYYDANDVDVSVCVEAPDVAPGTLEVTVRDGIQVLETSTQCVTLPGLSRQLTVEVDNVSALDAVDYSITFQP
jgi:hypothetical protein